MTTLYTLYLINIQYQNSFQVHLFPFMYDETLFIYQYKAEVIPKENPSHVAKITQKRDKKTWV